ncbi:heart- and neural crest derivatives-expressed protein 1-like [Varroa jacobsoni]|uniref:BHLH domain-containing protein n=1 Tax=Varroa destructor TaxID=109461 RepID=A0A7M7JK10_VARDE|nr:heart- and neural crest derivatives-expressed protein 1-like isoform X2 [Varroa destructor]XP_022653364.1 heart- and neural crest derivatives-expressed protein 1-like isoform X2 [Varroa destructor]XP_022692765.1 heart- and neural crest derivatives-expressed protein 1-like [Varroa jacobsoni]
MDFMERCDSPGVLLDERKERRRTHSINSAFGRLRSHIPNVPRDTKLSKIKTLRLAIAYISYLEELLRSERPCEIQEGCGFEGSDEEDFCDDNKPDCGLRNRTRTGWPHQVWAAEFSPSADKAIAAKGTARLERC